ncbi:hypothetical protein DET64_10318 [Marinobacter nauticus]|jgi:hypothetical protein|uniref:Uncharacterized protein n=3 Tax=Marinobacter TaxID=2742 RepID=A0A368V517_MARNT|nr:hypothetical protein DET64_10318 [Marinobacter nauticus]RCW36227.1 hypothetical protein DET51_10318 [Marinobacter nauticus]|tara:strand:- start:96 stop:551 length:456 start_codon:yes stop_codon:yes gene_type:complete
MNAMNARKQTEGKRAGAALLALPLMLLMALPAYAQSEDDAAFEYEERSTIDTIPFRSVAEEELANTVIEGGLAAPAAGVPVQQATDDDFYLDPLALQPRDPRTDLGRSEIPVEIRFSNPKVIPGQSHGNNYVIRPPENRTYDTLNTNLTGR